MKKVLQSALLALVLFQCQPDEITQSPIEDRLPEGETIKEEYIDHWKPKNLPELRQMVTKAVDHYHHTRPHNSMGKVSPEAFTEQWKKLPPEQRRKLIIFDNLFS